MTNRGTRRLAHGLLALALLPPFLAATHLTQADREPGATPPQEGAPGAQEGAFVRPEPETVERYRRAAEGSDRAIDHYNLGTALLLEGRTTEAQQPLQAASGSDRDIVRRHGFYNYGLSTAIEGRFGEGDGSTRRSALLAARQAFRQVLRERPVDDEARWNLELVDRWLEEEEQRSGQGSAGGQAQSPGGAGAGGAPSGGDAGDRQLTPEEAAALLDSAGRAEASIRDRVMGRNRFRDPVVERNW